MLIDDYLDQAKLHCKQDDIEFLVSKEWGQGRTVFGGVSAAILYAATKEYVDSERMLRSMSTNFVGPLVFGEPFQLHVEEIRSGKNVTQMQARAIQNGKNCVVSQFCFGLDRRSKIMVENKDQHELPPPSKANFIPQIPKVTPKFLKHFDLSIVKGGVPFLGKKCSSYHGWMRFKNPPQRITDAHIISLIDTWPPTLLQMLKWPAPASTVSWNIEFIHPHRELKNDDWFAYKAETRQAAGGYGHTEATIWDSHNEVIALSRQTVAVFD